MKARLDQTARDVLQLLTGLHEQIVSGWDLDRDTLTRVARPNVQAWVARATVDSKEVKIRVEAGKDGVFATIL